METTQESDRLIRIDASLSTIAPTWAGPQIGLLIGRFNIYGGVGAMPGAYVDGLDHLMSQNGSSARERDLATSAIRDNRSFLIGAEYHLTGQSTGWKVGFAAQRLTAKGSADARQFANDEDQAMANTAGSVLNTFGYDTTIDSDVTMNFGHVYAGYGWSLGEHWTIDAQVGASHIDSSSAKLSTRVAAFNDSSIGRKFLSDKEADLERTLRSDVWSPSLGISTHVWF